MLFDFNVDLFEVELLMIVEFWLLVSDGCLENSCEKIRDEKFVGVICLSDIEVEDEKIGDEVNLLFILSCLEIFFFDLGFFCLFSEVEVVEVEIVLGWKCKKDVGVYECLLDFVGEGLDFFVDILGKVVFVGVLLINY